MCDGELRPLQDDVYVPTHHLEHNLKRFYGSRSNIFNLHLETKVRFSNFVSFGLQWLIIYFRDS